jgi:hypothetical protein
MEHLDRIQKKQNPAPLLEAEHRVSIRGSGVPL